MATMNTAKLGLIRAGIMILALFGIALLWIVSQAILPEAPLGDAIRGMVGVALFFSCLGFLNAGR